jgi:hypothetical protein
VSQCAGLGASVQLSGQKLWRFRGIYQLVNNVYYVYSELDSFVLPERNEPDYT